MNASYCGRSVLGGRLVRGGGVGRAGGGDMID